MNKDFLINEITQMSLNGEKLNLCGYLNRWGVRPRVSLVRLLFLYAFSLTKC